MLVSRDYRERAWRALNGKWGTVALTVLLVVAVSSVCSAMSVLGVGAILLFILEGPIFYGYAVQSLNVVRGKRVDVSDMTAAKDRFGETVVAYIINSLFTVLWALLFIIPGIIAAYSYSMTFYVLVDNPNMTADEARRESMRLMEGNKWKLFKLHLSFIGWILLCALTFGILTLWVIPYIYCATAEFYDCLIPPRPTAEPVNNGDNTDYRNIDPFDLNSNNASGNTASEKTDEPFYVFEEERPRETPDNPDSTISGKK